ncbi:MAG: hypothetical protein U0800_19100 [Isosphaeraceae bacterium]
MGRKAPALTFDAAGESDGLFTSATGQLPFGLTSEPVSSSYRTAKVKIVCQSVEETKPGHSGDKNRNIL